MVRTHWRSFQKAETAMSSTVLEARAVITADDKTAAAFAAVEARIKAVSAQAKAMAHILHNVSTMTGAGAGVSGKAPVVPPIARDFQHLSAAVSNLTAAMNRAAGLVGPAVRNTAHPGARGAHPGVLGAPADMSGGRVAAGIMGAYAAHKTADFARTSLHTYREFDKERRYGRAVMGISDEEQEPLVKQAIHGGATSKFNDIQWLEGQRELAARGLNVDQVRALAEVSATIGAAMDKSLPESVKALEGAMFGFGKDTSTYEKAVENARRTADLQVKASKISGMSYDDLIGAYKYAATPFRMAGLSEEKMLAFAGVGKKSNMGGDEMGTAGRALVANMLSPTAGARTAMMAAGIDYSKYQHAGEKPMDAATFSKSIAQTYGVELTKDVQAGLQKIFNDKATVADAAKFAPAVTRLLKDALEGDDAKSLKSIAGQARRYRDASISGVDTNKLFNDLMAAMAKNPNLANAVFGPKQGARIKAAIGDPETFLHKLEELEKHSGGFAKDVADQRGAGFDGAMSRLEGAVKNLESRLGAAFDKDGKGGALTEWTDRAAAFVQKLAEADPKLQRLGVAAGAAAAAFAGFKGAEALLGGFGLKGSATALVGSAEALTAAAARLGGVPGARPGGVGTPGATGEGGKPGGFGGLGWRGLGMGLTLGSAVWNMPTNAEEWNKQQDENQKTSDKLDNWSRENLPWWLGPDAHKIAKEKLGGAFSSGSWSGGRHTFAPAGSSRDFTLGAGGGFAPQGTLVPQGGFGFGTVSNFDPDRARQAAAGMAAAPMPHHPPGGALPTFAAAPGGLPSLDSLASHLSGLKATVEGPVPVNVTGSADVTSKVTVEVLPSQLLLATVKAAEAAKTQIPLRSNSGASTPDAGGRKP